MLLMTSIACFCTFLSYVYECLTELINEDAINSDFCHAQRHFKNKMFHRLIKCSTDHVLNVFSWQ